MTDTNKEQVIENLICKSTKKTTGGMETWLTRMPKEAIPFIETLADRVENHGQKANARVVAEILEEQYDFTVSRSRVRLWLVDLEKRHAQKN